MRALAAVVAGALVLPLGAAAVLGAPETGAGEAGGGEAGSWSFAEVPSAEPPAARHVVAISIDGLRADVVTRLGPGRLPNLHRLLREGAGTLEARNLVEATITLPNHTSMLTGRPIRLDLGGHGIAVNDDRGGTVHDAAGGYVPSVFDVVHDAGLETALYATKPKFDLLDRTWDERHGAEDGTGADDGRDKITTYRLMSPSGAAAAVAGELASADPAAFTFLHLRNPDSAGHEKGWMSAAYLRAVREADRLVGEVLAAIDASPERGADTIVVLTADHGGRRDDHSTVTRPENYRIPFLVWGAGVPAGVELYDLNAGSRQDPGRDRIPYGGPQPIRNGEVANLALDLLGLPPVPGSRFDAEQDLVVTATG